MNNDNAMKLFQRMKRIEMKSLKNFDLIVVLLLFRMFMSFETVDTQWGKKLL